MDAMDKKIAEILQVNGRASSAEIAEAIGVSVSTANERVRRLAKDGVVTEWRAVLDPDKVGAPLCAFVLLDLAYEGEEEACDGRRRWLPALPLLARAPGPDRARGRAEDALRAVPLAPPAPADDAAGLRVVRSRRPRPWRLPSSAALRPD